MNARLSCLLLACIWALSEARGSRNKPKYVVAFGNSLTDNGVNEMTGDTHGFIKYSNGPIWPEYLMDMLHPKGYPRKNLQNYAYSAAKSGLDNFYFTGWSGVLWQVQEYLKANPEVPPKTLIALELGGGNDLFEAISGGDPSEEVIRNGLDAVDSLVRAGAEQLVAIEIVDPSPTPFFADKAPLVPLVKGLVEKINVGLRNGFAERGFGEGELAGIRLLDTSELWAKINDEIDNPFKIFNHQKNDTAQGEVFKFGFIDEYHPNTKTHHLLAERVYKAVGVIQSSEAEDKEDDGNVFVNLFQKLVDGFLKIKDTVEKELDDSAENEDSAED